MKKILEFLPENFQFLVVKFSVYLNRRVFVMRCRCFTAPLKTEKSKIYLNFQHLSGTDLL